MEQLKKWREANDWTAEMAGAGVGVSKVHWLRLENGDRAVTAEMAVKIERLTGIPREALRPDIFKQGADA